VYEGGHIAIQCAMLRQRHVVTEVLPEKRKASHLPVQIFVCRAYMMAAKKRRLSNIWLVKALASRLPMMTAKLLDKDA